MSREISFIGLFITIVMCFCACNKTDTKISSPSLLINSISPASGKFGITDTIHGTNFGNSISDVAVFFNTIPAQIVSMNDTLIIVMVPKNAGSGYVSIKKNGAEIKGPSFHYEYTVTVSTLAGKGYAGYQDGIVDDALFYFPRGIAIDADENLYVADYGNNCIRKIGKDGIVSTIAGNGIKSYRDGPAPDAEFYAVNGLAINGDNLFIADASRLRDLSLNGRFVHTIAGNAKTGNIDDTATKAEFSLIYGVTIDARGNIFVSDVNNNSIRKVTPYGLVTTIAGNEQGGYADGYGVNAAFSLPGQLTYDFSTGKLYVADAANARIRDMDLAGNVYTLAGSGHYGFKDGRFFEADFMFPTGIIVDENKNVYECGIENAIRKIDANGNVTTLAGTGVHGYADGPGEIAMFDQPIYLAMDKNGIIYVSDESNHCIRKVVIE